MDWWQRTNFLFTLNVPSAMLKKMLRNNLPSIYILPNEEMAQNWPHIATIVSLLVCDVPQLLYLDFSGYTTQRAFICFTMIRSSSELTSSVSDLCVVGQAEDG